MNNVNDRFPTFGRVSDTRKGFPSAVEDRLRRFCLYLLWRMDLLLLFLGAEWRLSLQRLNCAASLSGRLIWPRNPIPDSINAAIIYQKALKLIPKKSNTEDLFVLNDCELLTKSDREDFNPLEKS